jgi:hypothetical protein
MSPPRVSSSGHSRLFKSSLLYPHLLAGSEIYIDIDSLFSASCSSYAAVVDMDFLSTKDSLALSLLSVCIDILILCTTSISLKLTVVVNFC